MVSMYNIIIQIYINKELDTRTHARTLANGELYIIIIYIYNIIIVNPILESVGRKLSNARQLYCFVCNRRPRGHSNGQCSVFGRQKHVGDSDFCVVFVVVLKMQTNDCKRAGSTSVVGTAGDSGFTKTKTKKRRRKMVRYKLILIISIPVSYGTCQKS